MTTSSTDLDKYQLFHDLSTEVAKLIADLEVQLKQKMSKSASSTFSGATTTQKSKPLTYKIGQGLRSFWSGLSKKSESNLPSLKEYIAYNESINNLINIILEERNLFEQYEDIADIINKFKNDFRNTIKKYADILEPGYHTEKVQATKTHGTPYDVSEKDIEKHDEMNAYASIVRKHIHRVQKPDYESKMSDERFENGQIKPGSFADVLAWLIDSNINISNESEIDNALKKYGYTANNLISTLNYLYPKKEDIKYLYKAIRDRKINIPNSIEGIKKEFTNLTKAEMHEVLDQLDTIGDSGDVVSELNDAINKLSQEENLKNSDKVFYNIIKNYLVFDEENELSPEAERLIRKLYDHWASI